MANVTDLDLLCLLEEGTYWENRGLLGSGVMLCQEISECYNLLAGQYSLHTSVQRLDELQLVLLQMIAGSKMQLGTGTAALFRGHAADSKGNLRKSIEYALFAINLFEFPHSASKWLFAGRSKQDYKAYKDAFNIMDMLHPSTYQTLGPVETVLLETLIDRYETCCVQVHATTASVAPQVEFVRSEGKHDVRFHHVDKTRGLEVVRHFIGMLDTHTEIMKLYVQLLLRVFPQFDAAQATGIINTAENNINGLMEAWASRLYPDGFPEDLNKFWDLPKTDRRKKRSGTTAMIELAPPTTADDTEA